MVTAQAVTNERGSIIGEDSCRDGIKPLPSGGSRKSPWKCDVRYEHKAKLGTLTAEKHRAFSLLAANLIHIEKYPPDTPVMFGRCGTVRGVKIGNKEFRSDAYRLFSRRD